MPPSLSSRYRGTILLGAIGDALGAPVEFDSLRTIRHDHPGGVHEYQSGYGGIGRFTDDTQMTLFTAEGLLNAGRNATPDDQTVSVWLAYRRWYVTQRSNKSNAHGQRGLLGIPALHAARAPGGTCMSALGAARMGTPARPINDSKGCGGVMRAAPAGMVGSSDPFDLGCRIAATTHTHPAGYHSAGALAVVIDSLLSGHTLDEAVATTLRVLSETRNSSETLAAVRLAVDLASDRDVFPVSAETVERLGGGWVGEEALAIALYCALTCADEDGVEDALSLSVSHSGDSDSTGAIAGNILGALYGFEAIPVRYLQPLEQIDLLYAVADSLYEFATAASSSENPLTHRLTELAAV